MDAITNIPSSALEPWDAIICTSNAVKSHITNVLYQETERLSRRLGIRNFLLPQLPTIPLGINTEDFISSDEEISKYRKNLDIEDGSITVLYMGRLLSWQSESGCHVFSIRKSNRLVMQNG